MTVSEDLFENFCSLNGIEYSRLSPDGKKTPDYEANLGGMKTIVEIKELSVNSEEKLFLKSFEEDYLSQVAKGEKKVTVGNHTPGRRVRHKIEACKKQLRRFVHQNVPAVLLLYDTRPFPFEISSYDVKVAMYGFESIPLYPPDVAGESLKFGEHRFGKGKKLRSDSHTYISAVGVLCEKDRSGSLHVDFYLNAHADNPLSVESLISEKNITVYTVLSTQQFGDWHRVVSEKMGSADDLSPSGERGSAIAGQ